MSCEYVRKYYNVPAVIGRRIEFDGKAGIIAEDRGNYIGVNFDKDKPSAILNLHPTYKVKYLGMGKIRKMTRSQQRYKDYIRSDVDCSFAEWLGINNQ
jgi:hypothetical protein